LDNNKNITFIVTNIVEAWVKQFHTKHYLKNTGPGFNVVQRNNTVLSKFDIRRDSCYRNYTDMGRKEISLLISQNLM
jgi:hypothetical protein